MIEISNERAQTKTRVKNENNRASKNRRKFDHDACQFSIENSRDK